jgi:hypothetical protein
MVDLIGLNHGSGLDKEIKELIYRLNRFGFKTALLAISQTNAFYQNHPCHSLHVVHIIKYEIKDI